MKIISWNVNGLRSAWDKGFLKFVNEYNPDVLCLQEIKIDFEKMEKMRLDGYKLCFNCANKKGYSGVAIYCRDDFLDSNFLIGHERFDNEGRVVMLRFNNFVLINLYLPHGGRQKENLDYKIESYDLVLKMIGDLVKNKEKIILCGDFNVAINDIDVARFKSNRNNIMFSSMEREKLKEVVDLGFRDSFREIKGDEIAYTWWAYLANYRERNIGWRIDYIFVSEGFDILDAWIWKDVFGSDHCPVGVELK